MLPDEHRGDSTALPAESAPVSPPVSPARQLVSVVGGESTGKSTLAAALARDLPAAVVPETLRAWVELHGRVPRADEQRDVMRAHVRAEADALALPAPPAWVVSDSGPIMTAAYSIVYYDDDSLVSEAIELSAGLAVVAWCAADIPWVADGNQRDGPHMREQAQRVIGTLLADAGLPFVQVHGTVDQRVTQVRAFLAA